MPVFRLVTMTVVMLCLCRFSLLYATAPFEYLEQETFIKSNFTDSIPTSDRAVELIYFDGRTQNINSVHLEWITAREYKNRGFEIQRSVDGIDFQSIGFLEPYGDGNSTKSQHYHFMDAKLPGGKYYYRLKQMGFKEAFSYSSVLPISIQDFKDNFIAYPGAKNDEVYISSTGWRKEGKQLSYELINLKGEQIYNSGFTSTPAYLLSMSNYPTGAYYVLIRNEEEEIIGQLRVHREGEVASIIDEGEVK